MGAVHYGSKQGDIETSKFPLSHELGSEGSERASERTSAAERSARAKRAVRRKRMSELCDWTSEWLSTLRVDFIVIVPNVHY